MKIDLNEYLELDLSDTKESDVVIFSFPYFNFKRRDIYNFNFVRKQKYARLVAKKEFVCKGQLIEAGRRGAYVAIKHQKSQVKIGEKSWIGGAFMATNSNPCYVGKNVKVGNNTYFSGGSNAFIKHGITIGNNCNFMSYCKIDKKNIWGDNVVVKESLISGPKVIVGDNVQIATSKGLGNTVFLGVTPFYYNYYWWNKHLEPKRLSNQKVNLRTFIEQYVLDKYYKSLETRIGKDVNLACGCQVGSGAIIGDGAKFGLDFKVKPKSEVENYSLNK